MLGECSKINYLSLKISCEQKNIEFSVDIILNNTKIKRDVEKVLKINFFMNKLLN